MGSPVYIQIHNQLRENIEGGKWQVGEKIPAERELAAEFGVSRMTLRQAIQTLVDEGVLERRVRDLRGQPQGSRENGRRHLLYRPDGGDGQGAV